MAPRRVLLTLMAALGLALGLAGCAIDGDADPSVGAGDPAYEQVDAATFASRIAERHVVVLDVRAPAEYAAGHLEGAINLPIAADDFRERVADLDADATYAVYCRTGGRSQEALEVMRSAGIEAIYDLDGGITAWVKSGRPTAKD